MQEGTSTPSVNADEHSLGGKFRSTMSVGSVDNGVDSEESDLDLDAIVAPSPAVIVLEKAAIASAGGIFDDSDDDIEL